MIQQSASTDALNLDPTLDAKDNPGTARELCAMKKKGKVVGVSCAPWGPGGEGHQNGPFFVGPGVPAWRRLAWRSCSDAARRLLSRQNFLKPRALEDKFSSTGVVQTTLDGRAAAHLDTRAGPDSITPNQPMVPFWGNFFFLKTGANVPVLWDMAHTVERIISAVISKLPQENSFYLALP